MNERGSVTVLALGLALVAFAVAGIALDGTRVYLHKQSLQNAADSAALAGASTLDERAFYREGGDRFALDAERAVASARKSIAERGLAVRSDVKVASGAVEVTLRGSISTGWLRVLGISSLQVTAAARAEPRIGAVPAP